VSASSFLQDVKYSGGTNVNASRPAIRVCLIDSVLALFLDMCSQKASCASAAVFKRRAGNAAGQVTMSLAALFFH